MCVHRNYEKWNTFIKTINTFIKFVRFDRFEDRKNI